VILTAFAKGSAGLDKKINNQDFFQTKKDHRNTKKLNPEHCT
jgi:hypothetical protein